MTLPQAERTDTSPQLTSERYYEVKNDLKSLFQQKESKPFRFFDDADDETSDPFSSDVVKSKTLPRFHLGAERHSSDDEPDSEDPAPLSSTTFSVLKSPHQTFFFNLGDPRIEEGRTYLTLTEAEMEASLEEWKKTRPQVAADFKKLKKQANRKRKYFEARN